MDKRPSKLNSEDIRKEAQAYREKQARLDRARKRADQRSMLTRASGASTSSRRSLEAPSLTPPPSGPKKQRSKARRRRPRRVITPRGWFVLALLALLIVFSVQGLLRSCSGPGSIASGESTESSTAANGSGIDGLLSKSAILVDMGNGNILFEAEPDTPRFPASLTKMMTVYVAVTSGEDMAQSITLTTQAFEGLYEQSAATSGLEIGEVTTFRDLLYASMLASGGEASQAIALAVSGDMERFVERMNDEAKKIGMDSTQFTNPTGLHDPNQKTTARDLSRFLKHALGNADFREVFTTSTYTTSPTNYHPDGLIFQATYRTHMDEFNFHPPRDRYEILGGKTGYTPEAGNCLASLAGKEHQEYIVITLGAEGDGENYYPALKDTLRLYDQFFSS